MARKAKVRERLYYKIGEACRLLDIQPYVLRYWETEFPALSPGKSKSGQRVYSGKELGVIRRIKQLLYEEGYTIAGAKKRLEADLARGLPADEEGGGGAALAGNGEGALDTPEAEQIEQLRRGVEAALREAKEILARLGSKPK